MALHCGCFNKDRVQYEQRRVKASLWWRERFWTPCRLSPHPSDQHLATAFPHQLCTGLQSCCSSATTHTHTHARTRCFIWSMQSFIHSMCVCLNINSTMFCLVPWPGSSICPRGILQTCVFALSSMFASVKMCVSLCTTQGCTPSLIS